MPDPDATALLVTGLTRLAARQADYALAADYYAGRHRVGLPSEALSRFGWVFKDYRCNLCPAVVDPLVDKLEVTGFGVEGVRNKRLAARLGEQAWAIWQANRMDRRSGIVHLEAVTAGDAYLIIWPDEAGRARFYPQAGAAMTVGYDEDEPERIRWALKAWAVDQGTGQGATGKRTRVTLYLPDHIEKYITPEGTSGLSPDKAASLIPFQVPREPWPLPNPYGVVPVGHFPNNAGMSRNGRSELADIIPLQDELNKAGLDKMVAKEFGAFRQRWATGLEVPVNPMTGEPERVFTASPGELWSVPAEQTRFGDFAATEIVPYIEDENNITAKIARVSRTPAHLLLGHTGTFPSGESLKTAAAPFTAKVVDRQLSWGNVWEDVIALAVQMEGGPAAQFSTIWTDPTPQNEREEVETLVLKKDLGVSDEQLLREAGYTEEQIVTMLAERDARAASMAAALAAAPEAERAEAPV